MPTELTLAQHLEGLRASMVAFVRYADRAGLGAEVPTCPGWSVRSLVAHQGMVHRWATALLRGERVDPDAVEGEGATAPDPLEWLRDGAIEVARAVTAGGDETRGLVFLNDAPEPPPRFWARRQCHETTIHAVDALSAALGRFPRSDDTWIDPVLALDGIDELLAGFLTRPQSRLRTDDPMTLVVAPDDADAWWRMELGPQPAVTTRCTGPVEAGDAEVAGPAVGLYLALWNRSDHSTDVRDASGVVDLWRRRSVVRWT